MEYKYINKDIYLCAALFVITIGCVLFFGDKRISQLRDERDRYKGNAESLFAQVETFKIRDSLNGARVGSLELTIKEYERFRAEDAALIRELKAKNRDLASVNKTQSQTIIDLQAVPRDTIVVVRDSLRVPAVAVHCGDAWYDFNGLLTAQEFTGTLSNRDSLVLAETVRYKRFLWWKTRRVKDRQLEVVSMNPHTKILGMEHVVIEK